MQDLKNLRVRDAVEAAVGEHRADRFAVGSGAAFERMDDRERGLAFAEVAGHGLAEDVFGGGEVEHVVDDLEGEAEIAAVFAELRLDLVGIAEAVRRRDRRAELHRHLEETGRLAEDEVEVLFFVDQVAELLHLQQLALDHLLRERDEQFEDAEVALLQRATEGLHVEPVAGEHALRVAPGRVRRRTSAARVGLVDDVVVDQRRGVEHLDDRAEADAALARAAERLGREQQQQRANALAAAGDQVAARCR